MMLVDCPHCATKLNLPADLGGSVVRCPKCSETFRAESQTPAQAERMMPPPVQVRAERPERYAADESKESSSSGMLVLVGAIAVILLLIGGAGAWFFTNITSDFGEDVELHSLPEPIPLIESELKEANPARPTKVVP